MEIEYITHKDSSELLRL